MDGVFVTTTAQFLPGEPVGNDRMADYIGRLSPAAERLGRLTLRQNRIRTRHYAMRPDGSSDWTVAKLAAQAVRGVVDEAEVDARDIGFLATATTQNDMMVPGLASGVHAALGLPPTEVASFQSVCASSMTSCRKPSNANRVAGR